MNEHNNGCNCATCKEWRLQIYLSGKWPRPRVYNGEVKK